MDREDQGVAREMIKTGYCWLPLCSVLVLVSEEEVDGDVQF